MGHDAAPSVDQARYERAMKRGANAVMDQGLGGGGDNPELFAEVKLNN